MTRGKPIVIASYNAPDGVHCIDIQRKLDGTYSWLLCRRDSEDGHGWRILHGFEGHGFETQTAAETAAALKYDWVGSAF